MRDQLLDVEFNERDWVVVGATAQQMLDLNFRQVGKDFPVFLHPDTNEEYALARTERKSGTGYHGFSIDANEGVTLEQDLLRRDLTINAIARNEHGELIDPYGGVRDLKSKTLRHVSPAFSEDPLRVLRVARFAARFNYLGFSVADATLDLMREISASGELLEIAPERVWQETHRALDEESPVTYFRVLREAGALRVLFPEIEKLYGIPQTKQWHPEIDTGVHNEMALEQVTKLTPDARVRFAVLCHDLGKGETPAHILPSHHGHEEISAVLTEALCGRLKTPREFRELAVHTARYHLHCHRAFELKPSTILKTLMALDTLRKPERFEQFLIACEADARGRLGFEDSPYPQADFLRGAQQVLADSQKTIAERAKAKPQNMESVAQDIRLAAIKTYCNANRSN